MVSDDPITASWAPTSGADWIIVSRKIARLERDLTTARSALDIATGALDLIRSNQQDESPAATTRAEGIAVHALARIAALTPATGEPTT